MLLVKLSAVFGRLNLQNYFNIKQSFLIYKKNTIFAQLFIKKLDNEGSNASLFL
jgi:hypothetical protein